MRKHYVERQERCKRSSADVHTKPASSRKGAYEEEVAAPRWTKPIPFSIKADSDLSTEDVEKCATQICLRPADEKVDWVQCDGCEGWFHMHCVGLVNNSIRQDEDYYCTCCQILWSSHTCDPKSQPAAHLSLPTCYSEQLHVEDVRRRESDSSTPTTHSKLKLSPGQSSQQRIANKEERPEDNVHSPGAAPIVKEEMDIGSTVFQRKDIYYNLLPCKPENSEDQHSGSCLLVEVPLKDVARRQEPESSTPTTIKTTDSTTHHSSKCERKSRIARHCCSGCRKTFRTEQTLRRHIMSVHLEQKPFVCDTCRKSFSQKISLERHMFVHTGFKPYCCAVCGNSFMVKSDLTYHVKFHTGEKHYNCQLCSKVFSKKTNLKRHMPVHTGQKSYSCNLCRKSFSQTITLSRHMVVHADKKPYCCEVCSKSFTQTSSLTRHMFVHSRHKPHKCCECRKSFIRRSQLNQHMLTH